jgi:hypothetical protein
MAYATIEQLSASWREFADYEKPHLEQALEDVAVWLDLQLDRCGKSAQDVPADALRVASCNVVRRSFGELDATNADDQWSTLVEPTAVNVTGTVSHSDFYLTKWECRMLGVRCGCAAFGSCS